jgi:serine/threonine-protein kinase HipA
MKKAKVYVHNNEAGILTESSKDKYTFEYQTNYIGEPVSLTMPVKKEVYFYNEFPSFFEGLLPEGFNLIQLLRLRKIDKKDYFSQLMYVGTDVIGAVTIIEIND